MLNTVSDINSIITSISPNTSLNPKQTLTLSRFFTSKSKLNTIFITIDLIKKELEIDNPEKSGIILYLKKNKDEKENYGVDLEIFNSEFKTERIFSFGVVFGKLENIRFFGYFDNEVINKYFGILSFSDLLEIFEEKNFLKKIFEKKKIIFGNLENFKNFTLYNFEMGLNFIDDLENYKGGVKDFSKGGVHENLKNFENDKEIFLIKEILYMIIFKNIENFINKKFLIIKKFSENKEIQEQMEINLKFSKEVKKIFQIFLKNLQKNKNIKKPKGGPKDFSEGGVHEKMTFLGLLENSIKETNLIFSIFEKGLIFYKNIFSIINQDYTIIKHFEQNCKNWLKVDLESIEDEIILNSNSLEIIKKIIFNKISKSKKIENKNLIKILIFLEEKIFLENSEKNILKENLKFLISELKNFLLNFKMRSKLKNSEILDFLRKSQILKNKINNIKFFVKILDEKIYKNLKNEFFSLEKKEKNLYKIWLLEFEKIIFFASEKKNLKNLYKLNLEENKIKINFPENFFFYLKNFKISKEILAEDQKLSKLTISEKTEKFIEEKKILIKNSQKLREISNFYNNIEKNIKKKYFPFLLEYILIFEKKLKNENFENLEKFIFDVENIILILKKNLEKLQKIEKKVILILKKILEKKETNFFYLENLKKILKNFGKSYSTPYEKSCGTPYEKSEKKNSENKSFIIYLNHQIIKVIFYQIKLILKKKKKFFFRK